MSENQWLEILRLNAELTRLKELVFGDEVRGKVLEERISRCDKQLPLPEPPCSCPICGAIEDALGDFQKAIKKAVET